MVDSNSHVGIVFNTVIATFGAEPSLPVSFTLLSFVYVLVYVCACSFIGVCTGTRVWRQSHVCTSTWRSEVDSGYLHQALSTPCLKFYFMQMFVLFTCLFVHPVFAVPVEARRV